MMELPHIPLPLAFMTAIWRRAERYVADWFYPIRQTGGFITHEAKRELARNLPILENNIRHLLRVLAEQAGIIAPPTSTSAPSAPSAPSALAPETPRQPADADLNLMRFMSRPILFKLEAQKASKTSGSAPAIPRATNPKSAYTPDFMGTPPDGSTHATPDMVERLSALVEVFMDLDTHILRMRKHLGKNPGLIRPRPHVKDTLLPDIVRDVMALDLYHRRGIIPAPDRPPP